MPIQDNTVIWKIKKISNVFNVGADVASFEALRLAYEERFNNLSEALVAACEERLNAIMEQTNSLVNDVVTAKLGELPPAVYTATCATALKTTAKVATITNADNFVLKAGVSVLVEFTNSSDTAELANYLTTLNVNNTGAIAIKKATASGSDCNVIVIMPVLLFVYNGANWVLINTPIRIKEYSDLA